MVRPNRQSLLVRLLGVYLLFVAAVLGTGLGVDILMQRPLLSDVQAADLALARSIALEVDASLRSASQSLNELSALDEIQSGDIAAMERAFRAFKAARQDVDRVYWFDPSG